jgi:hypothetical protein
MASKLKAEEASRLASPHPAVTSIKNQDEEDKLSDVVLSGDISRVVSIAHRELYLCCWPCLELENVWCCLALDPVAWFGFVLCFT